MADEPLYHGTWAGWLRRGQLIRPANDLRSSTFGLRNFRISSPDHTYASASPEEAKWYAELGYKNIEELGHKINDIPIYGARPVVYQVEPRGRVERDPSSDYYARAAYRIHGPLKILGKQWEG